MSQKTSCIFITPIYNGTKNQRRSDQTKSYARSEHRNYKIQNTAERLKTKRNGEGYHMHGLGDCEDDSLPQSGLHIQSILIETSSMLSLQTWQADSKVYGNVKALEHQNIFLKE